MAQTEVLFVMVELTSFRHASRSSVSLKEQAEAYKCSSIPSLLALVLKFSFECFMAVFVLQDITSKHLQSHPVLLYSLL